MVDEKLVEECVEAAIEHISSCLEPPQKIEDWFASNLVREIVIVSLGTAMHSAREVDGADRERGLCILEGIFADVWPILGDKLSDDDWEALGAAFKHNYENPRRRTAIAAMGEGDVR